MFDTSLVSSKHLLIKNAWKLHTLGIIKVSRRFVNLTQREEYWVCFGNVSSQSERAEGFEVKMTVVGVLESSQLNFFFVGELEEALKVSFEKIVIVA